MPSLSDSTDKKTVMLSDRPCEDNSRFVTTLADRLLTQDAVVLMHSPGAI